MAQVTYNFRSLTKAQLSELKAAGKKPTSFVTEENKDSEEVAKLKAAGMLYVEKRASVLVEAPILSWEDLVDLVNAAPAIPGTLTAVQALLLDQANMVTHDAIQAQFAEQDRTAEADVSKLDLTKVDFVTIANTPKASRANPISDEAWANFEATYIPVMQEVTGKSETVLSNHVAIFKDGFNQVAKAADKMSLLENLLTTFASEQANVDGNEDILNYLFKRVSSIKARTSKTDLEL
jgi:hypothetical protein